MKERAQKPRGPLTWMAARTCPFWVALVFVLPLLYAASFGPYWWLATRGFVSKQYAGSAFAPLKWASEQSPTTYSALIWYANLWGEQEILPPYRASTPAAAPGTAGTD